MDVVDRDLDGGEHGSATAIFQYCAGGGWWMCSGLVMPVTPGSGRRAVKMTIQTMSTKCQ